MSRRVGADGATWDVVVVGGGLSGVLVAQRLVRAGLDVLLLEAGPRPARPLPADWSRFDEGVRHLLEVDTALWGTRSVGRPYDFLPVRALGGRSLVWGGWCVRPTAQSWRDARAAGAPWPVSFAELEPYFGRVERWLNVRVAEAPRGLDRVRRQLGLRTARKRCAVLPRGSRPTTAIDRLRGLSIRGGAIALELIVADSRVRGVLFRCEGSTLVARARAVVLCASPIETARILAASEVAGPVGEGLSDHAVASCVVVGDASRSRPPKVVRPLSSAALVPRFVNVAGQPPRDYLGGFTTEIVGPRSAEILAPEVRAELAIANEDARSFSFHTIHAIGELMPARSRRVTFDRKNRDPLGRPRPVIHPGRVAGEGGLFRDLNETVVALADAIADGGSKIVLVRDPRAVLGAGHEAGTCAMGGGGAVTDRWGAIRGVGGAWVADASVMPTPLDCHPTLTVLALALRTADRIVERLRRGEA